MPLNRLKAGTAPEVGGKLMLLQILFCGSHTCAFQAFLAVLKWSHYWS